MLRKRGGGRRHIFKIKIGKGLLNFYLKISWGGSVLKPYVYAILKTTVPPWDVTNDQSLKYTRRIPFFKNID